ncbi:MAG: class I SAM-dependent methyltransferase [Nitriliruptorales bacterium]|nr:class I SAM-dependent methyltransferase [Nitriliruptorales bacterium]
MSRDERERWDHRYASGDYTPRTQPTPFLVDWLDRILAARTGDRRALDVATGTGRNALAMAEAGFEVDAIDVSEVALDRARAEAERRGLEVNWVVGDLDDGALPHDSYDLITVIRYRNPDLWPRLRAALAPDGWILVEHHLRTDREDVAGPGDDRFRLEPGELLEVFADLRVVHYSESVEPADMGDGPLFVIARFVACAGDPGW